MARGRNLTLKPPNYCPCHSCGQMKERRFAMLILSKWYCEDCLETFYRVLVSGRYLDAD